ncbi:hypothetical protein Kpol_457p13 [Vanderwaltozyma polyspora DSM 70294]|uniref:Large ribosomal subunit protein uL30-like ferredoxin-like fold domain-containing protein n=1 Tax=Vanderwaltozyma polyspora (strain ATCC 22028 / DSM 70294 / BCRC 21397 / CBS 2163 / NBRC 10782 / NRRL Y-8283 / UCD 57-17) TaxID=436907 RepID=A7TQV4_VANPO|nr:uncharacterized protein Kpol_457p13 [Vanderwaltozyma polyspora DSM 70294]EDO15362.1 hypothetical protein Kpol_457p13 [Vanderwaltozyma polyspora DSM 70294]
MSSSQLNSNPEILLRKRRNADRTRLEKQELSKARKIEQDKKRRLNKNKFVRIEKLVTNTLATEREKERIKRISKLELKKSKNELDHLPTDKNFILKITERDNSQSVDEDIKVDDEEENDLIKEKVIYDGEETLLFVIRVKGPNSVKLPSKVFKILSLLRLVDVNTGVFIKLTENVFPLLKIISPYVITGRPSLSSIRSLIQKRSRILISENDEQKEVILNDNNVIEDKLGSEGIICMEDIIHEISTLGDSFQTVNFFLQPFRLSREVSGFSALSKLNKLKQKEDQSKLSQSSNSSTAPIVQVDIDALISKLN